MDTIANYHVVIHGRVQGVSFRYRAQEKARRFCVNGWIRNTDDGSVEAVVEGGQEDVDRFLKWCRRGPLFARVQSLDAKPGVVQGFESFEIVG